MNKEILTNQHDVLYKMLADFDEFCNEYNISYMLAGGSLLGAVREGCIIEWDDDIDLMMDRQNYDKFIEYASDFPQKEYYIQTRSQDENWNYLYTKIRKNNTVWSTEFSSQFPEMHQGIFIDLFVQDKTSNIKIISVAHMLAIVLLRKIVTYKWKVKKGIIPSKSFLGAILRPISLQHSINNLEKVMKYYKYSDSKYMIDSSGMHLKNGRYPLGLVAETSTVNFGSKQYPIPKGYVQYLSYLYGDNYMTPQKYKHNIVNIKM